MVTFDAKTITSVSDLEKISRTFFSSAWTEQNRVENYSTWTGFMNYSDLNKVGFLEDVLFFRWEIKGIETEGFELHLFFVNQQLGTVYCEIVRSFNDSDVKDFLDFLAYRRQFINNLWSIY